MVGLGKDKTKEDKKEKPSASEAKAAKAAKKVKKASKKNDAAVKVAELENRLLRLQADFDNFRKRVARERNETYTRANEDLLSEVIPVIDHMDMALTAAADHDAPEALLNGVTLVGEQLKGVLGKFGLEKIDASGKEFDPNEHEAISHLPSEDVPDNNVMQQTRLGYKLKGRILRPAQVVVSSGVKEDEPGPEPEAKG
jgi:molecular chaperone GrpE